MEGTSERVGGKDKGGPRARGGALLRASSTCTSTGLPARNARGIMTLGSHLRPLLRRRHDDDNEMSQTRLVLTLSDFAWR